MLSMLLRIIAFIIFTGILPIIFISLLIILIEDGFPVFFVQRRLGKNKKEFLLLKIRTMKKNTPNLGTHQISSSNYLKFGLFLRKFKVDELPQVINYLWGDIALVGPRPGLPNQIELMKAREKRGIFSMKPGITGLGQVLEFDMSNPIILSKIDALYIQKKSITLDITIFISTFIKYFRKKLYNDFKKEIELIKEDYA